MAFPVLSGSAKLSQVTLQLNHIKECVVLSARLQEVLQFQRQLSEQYDLLFTMQQIA